MSLRKNNLICQCYVTQNYFIHRTCQHVTYTGKEEFLKTYSGSLEQHGCTKEDIEEIVKDLESERLRRRTQGRASAERRKVISEKYTPLNRHVYELREEFLSNEFRELAQMCKDESVSKSEVLLHLECLKGAPQYVYRFPVFEPQFCSDLKAEINHFEKSDLPKSRPNTMNQYGVVMEDMLDLDEKLIRPLRERYLSPIARFIFPKWVADGLDSHKAFVVSYRMGQDIDLDYHYDNAEVTCNISLDSDFEGGVLYFGPMRTERRQNETTFTTCLHKLGHGLLHRGQQLHGAMPLEDGERQNLIIWMRSSKIRNRLCPMCDREPAFVETEGVGDGFAVEEADVCATL